MASKFNKDLTIENYLELLICRVCDSKVFISNRDSIKCELCKTKIGIILSANPPKIIFKENKSELIHVKISDKLTPWKKENFEFLKQHLEAKKGLVVDLGSGPSPFADLFPRRISIDNLNFPNVNLICDATQKIPLASSIVDTLIATNFLEHTHVPKEVLSEINRIMKIKAKVYITVPFLNGVHQKPYDFFRFTNYELNLMLEESGFRIIRFECGNDLDTFRKMVITFFKPYTGKKPFVFLIYKFQKIILNLLEKNLARNYRMEFTSGYMIKAEKIKDMNNLN